MTEFNPHNNGGKTDYYDLPKPSEIEIFNILAKHVEDQVGFLEAAAKEIIENLPQTLNDLIEHKDMRFWRGDAFKALYALDERAAKANDGSTTEVRELNKVIYYCQRRLDAIAKQEREKEKTQADNL